MRFYIKQHTYYCGIDLHAKVMYACVLNSSGEIVAHKNMRSTPAAFLEFIEPFREDVVIAVECIFTWYWLSDLCSDEEIPFVLGHALYMKAIHGGKAKNDKIDSHKIATLLRGGMLPQAYVYPPAMRSTRDLMRRRLYFVRLRGSLTAHIQNTNHQCNLVPLSTRLSTRAGREGVPERFEDPSVRYSMEVDVEMIGHYDKMIGSLERFIVNQVKEHDYDLYRRLRTIPGVGKILALTILYEVHDIARFPRVQEFASYSRLVKCAKESAGKRLGSSGKKIGNVHLKWAFSEAAICFLRGNAQGQKYLQRMSRKHGKGKALSILAHKLGRAVYFVMSNRRNFDMRKFLAV